MHKLSPPWEGPFIISKALGNGSYYLIDAREEESSSKLEQETKHPWNINLLRPFLHLAFCKQDIFLMINKIKPVPPT